MSILSGVSEFFGLDIGTTAIRLVQLKGDGPVKSLAKYGYIPLDSRLAMSVSKADQLKVIQAVHDLLGQARVTTKNVAVGIPSQNAFTAVVDVDRLSTKELGKSIKYQIDSLVPVPLAKSKIDWALMGDSPKDKNKVEVLISSVPDEFIERRLDLLEASGLNVIAFEPDNLALARALIPAGAITPHMVIDIGNKSTDIVISVEGGPRFTKSIPTGAEAMVRAAAQSLNIDDKQAQQFVFKFGLNKDKLEGQIFNALISTVDVLTTEIEKSIKFFMARYGESAKLERIIVTGAASVLPEFPLYIANKFSINAEIGNSWRNVAYPANRQNELLAVSNHFGVAAGLAERME